MVKVCAMPSDAKKREQQRKKDAAKARQTGKKAPQQPKTDEKESSPSLQINGTGNSQTSINGTQPLTVEGWFGCF